jgi:hypothetical protein
MGRTAGVELALDAHRCHGPLLAELSGDRLHAQVLADFCNRPVFINNANDSHITVLARDQQSSSIIETRYGTTTKTCSCDT